MGPFLKKTCTEEAIIPMYLHCAASGCFLRQELCSSRLAGHCQGCLGLGLGCLVFASGLP